MLHEEVISKIDSGLNFSFFDFVDKQEGVVLCSYHSFIGKPVNLSFEVDGCLFNQRYLFLSINTQKPILKFHMQILSEYFESINIHIDLINLHLFGLIYFQHNSHHTQ